MIRAFTFAALALGLAACGSSGPTRPSIPGDPSLVTLQHGMTAADYTDRRYGSMSTWRKQLAAAAPAGTGVSLQRMLLPKEGGDRVLRNIYATGNKAPQSTVADYHVVDVLLEGAATADGLPVYRLTLLPRSASIDALALPEIAAIPVLGTRVPVPLADAERLENGGLRSADMENPTAHSHRTRGYTDDASGTRQDSWPIRVNPKTTW